MNFNAFEQTIPFTKKLSVAYGLLREYLKIGARSVFSAVVVTISISIFVVGTGVMLGLLIRDYLRGSEDAPLGVVLIIAGVFVLVLWLIAYSLSLVGKFAVTMQLFAADNNLEFQPRIKVDRSRGFAFAATKGMFARNGVTGNVAGRTFWLYEYRFFSGSGRHPYPNIFTVFLLHLDKDYPQTTFINKKGRLKILWPRTGIKKVEAPWFDAPSLRVFTEDGQLPLGVSKLLPAEKIQYILEISPKAEIEIKDKSLRVFLPGRPIPTKEEAEKLFAFANDL